MKIETMQEAGSQKWGVMIDGLLDTRTLGYATEQGAENRAKADFPNEEIITTEDSRHYSNQRCLCGSDTKHPHHA